MHISASYRNIIRCLIEIHPVIIEKYRQTNYKQADRPSGSFIPCKLSFWGFNYLENKGFLTLYHTIPTFNDPEKEPFENSVGKEENAGNQHFLLFPQCFLSYLEQILPFESTLSSANAFNFDWCKILSSGKGLKHFRKQEGHDGPVSLHWLIREIHSYQTLHYLGIGFKHKTPYKD